MKTCIIAALALLSTSALATNYPKPPEVPNVESSSHSAAESNAVAASLSSAVSASKSDANSASLSGAVAHGGDGGSASALGGASTATATGGSADSSATGGNATGGAASATNNGNANVSLNQTYEAKRNAPAIAAPSIYPTAGCQAGVSMGGSGPGGAGLLGFSFTKKECEIVVLAQNFASIGMTDTACDILKTTKAFQRTGLKDVPCVTPKPLPPPAVPAAPTNLTVTTPDLSQYVKRDELAERDRRLMEAATRK